MMTYEIFARLGMIDMRQDDMLSRLHRQRLRRRARLRPSWPQVLAAAADYVGGQAAGLLSKDTASAVCTVHHQFGFESGYVSTYRNEYWKMDPFVVSPFFPIEQPTTFKDYVPLGELREGRFYREWLQPQGWLDAASIVLETVTDELLDLRCRPP